MSSRKAALPPPEAAIINFREQRVILDADLARIYGVPTKRFNEAFKRNRHRFPDDFAFQLTPEEFRDLRSQFATSSSSSDPADVRQSTVPTPSHGGRRSRPWVFTEHGALMAANILRSDRAIEMSVYVVRAFIRQREQMATSDEILRKLESIDHRLLEHDQALVIVWNKIKELMHSAPPPPPKPKPRIGFKPG